MATIISKIENFLEKSSELPEISIPKLSKSKEQLPGPSTALLGPKNDRPPPQQAAASTVDVVERIKNSSWDDNLRELTTIVQTIKNLKCDPLQSDLEESWPIKTFLGRILIQCIADAMSPNEIRAIGNQVSKIYKPTIADVKYYLDQKNDKKNTFMNIRKPVQPSLTEKNALLIALNLSLFAHYRIERFSQRFYLTLKDCKILCHLKEYIEVDFGYDCFREFFNDMTTKKKTSSSSNIGDGTDVPAPIENAENYPVTAQGDASPAKDEAAKSEVTVTQKVDADANNAEKEEVEPVSQESTVTADLTVSAAGDSDDAEKADDVKDGQEELTVTDPPAPTVDSAATVESNEQAEDPIVSSDNDAGQEKDQLELEETATPTTKVAESDATVAADDESNTQSKAAVEETAEPEINGVAATEAAEPVEEQKVEAVAEVEIPKAEDDAPKESENAGLNNVVEFNASAHTVEDDASAKTVEVDEKSTGDADAEVVASPETEQDPIPPAVAEQDAKEPEPKAVAPKEADSKANDVTEPEKVPEPIESTETEVPNDPEIKISAAPVVTQKSVDTEEEPDEVDAGNTSSYETADEAEEEEEEDENEAPEKNDSHPSVTPKQSDDPQPSAKSLTVLPSSSGPSKPSSSIPSPKLSRANSKNGKPVDREKYRLIFQESVDAFLAKDFKNNSIKTIVASIPDDVVVSEETFRKVFEHGREVQKLPQEERELPLSYLYTCFHHLADAEPIFLQAFGNEKFLTSENFDVKAVTDTLKVSLDHNTPVKASERQLAWALMGNFSKTLRELFRYCEVRTHRFAPNLMKAFDAIAPMLLKIDPAGVRFTEAFINTVKWNVPNDNRRYWDNVDCIVAALIKGSVFNGGIAFEYLLKKATEDPKEIPCILYVALYINNYGIKVLWDTNATTVRNPQILVGTLLKMLANDSAVLVAPYAAFSVIDFAGKIGISWGPVFRDNVKTVEGGENVDWRIRCALFNRLGLLGPRETSDLVVPIPKSLYKVIPDKNKNRFSVLDEDEEESIENYLFHVMEFVLMGTMIPELFLENARSVYTPNRKFFDTLKTNTCRAVKSVEELYTPEISFVYQSMVSKLIEVFFPDTSCSFMDAFCNFQHLNMAKYQSCLMLGQVAFDLIVDRCGYKAQHLDNFLASEYSVFSAFVTAATAYSRGIYAQRNDRSVPWRKVDSRPVWSLNDYQQSMFTATSLLTVGLQLLERITKPPAEFIDVLQELEKYLGYIGPAIKGHHLQQFERTAQRPPIAPKFTSGNRPPGYYQYTRRQDYRH